MANHRKEHKIDPAKLDLEINKARVRIQEEKGMARLPSKKEVIKMCGIGGGLAGYGQDKRSKSMSEARAVKYRNMGIMVENAIVQG